MAYERASDTRWVSTWDLVQDGVLFAQARLDVEGFQDPDLATKSFCRTFLPGRAGGFRRKTYSTPAASREEFAPSRISEKSVECTWREQPGRQVSGIPENVTYEQMSIARRILVASAINTVRFFPRSCFSCDFFR